jgi:hypothetical protein
VVIAVEVPQEQVTTLADHGEGHQENESVQNMTKRLSAFVA